MSDIIAAIMTAWPGARIKPITRIAMELTPQEITAILAASPAGGEYLEKLGKTDLAVLTEDEWMGFLESVIRAFQDSMAESHAPFAVNRSEDDPCRPITADEITH
jgi:hypothetical protein